MFFEEALILLKNGREVSRKKYGFKYLKVVDLNLFSEITTPYIVITDGVNAEIWTPLCQDLFAQDWVERVI